MILDAQKKPIHCTKCDSQDIIRSGMSRDKQRYQCKNCNSFFVPKSLVKQRQSLTKQKAAMLMYLAGAQVKDMGKVFGVSYPTISKWIEPIQRIIDKNPDLKEVRRLGNAALRPVRSPRDVPVKPHKNWLLIELDDDHFDARSILLADKS